MRKHDHIPISFLAIPFVFSALPNVLNAQILVQDTLLLTFPDAGFVAPVVMDSVIDKRGQDAHVLGTYEKKLFLIIPVDLFVCTKKPLHREIFEALQPNRTHADSLRFKIIIDEFILSKKTNSLLYPRYIVNAAISLYAQRSGGGFDYVGQVLHESNVRSPVF